MEEIQTKKLNLKALGKVSSEENPEASSPKTTDEAPTAKVEDSLKPAVTKEETSAKEETSKKSEKIDSWKKEEADIPMKKISLNMLKKDDEEKTETSEIKKEAPQEKEEKWTNIHKISLKKEEKDTSNSEKVENKVNPSEENTEIANKKADSSLANSKENSEEEKNQEETKKENEKQEEEKEEKHTIVSPEENHDNTAVINAIIWEEEAEKQEKEKETKEEEKEEVHFQNYESSFKKQSSKVIERIQNFRYAPKTRKWLIISLVIPTVCLIWILMLIMPEKHSLNIYKASLVEIYNEISGNETSNPLAHVDSGNPFPDANKNENNDILDSWGQEEENEPQIDTSEDSNTIEETNNTEENTDEVLSEEEIKIIEENKKKKYVNISYKNILTKNKSIFLAQAPSYARGFSVFFKN